MLSSFASAGLNQSATLQLDICSPSLPVCWQCVTNAAASQLPQYVTEREVWPHSFQELVLRLDNGGWFCSINVHYYNFHKKLCGFMLALLLNFNFWRCKIRTLKGKLIIVTLSDHHINLISTVYLLALIIDSAAEFYGSHEWWPNFVAAPPYGIVPKNLASLPSEAFNRVLSVIKASGRHHTGRLQRHLSILALFATERVL